MKVEEFDYYLPMELIAQKPIKNRLESRLLVLDKNNGEIAHKKFVDLIDYFSKGDILVVNNSKVLPARLFGIIGESNKKIGILLLRDLKNNKWECLVKPFRKIEENMVIYFDESLQARCVLKKTEGIVQLEFLYQGDFLDLLNKLGEMPLPPYIKEKLSDANRYQTVYAKEVGSVAAPTAGLHFTDEIFEKLQKKGVKVINITLHVGIGTFRPVQVSEVSQHKMHDEFYEIDDEAALALNQAKAAGKKIFCVGTTTVRTLESAINNENKFTSQSGFTDIFIYPGYQFRVIDAMITNFHLPKSTLIMMVSAFAKKDYIMNAYKEAVSAKYRFFSFGDAMLIK